jgi:uncharacterized protein
VRPLPLAAAALLLAGCGASPPSKFYVLTADPAPPQRAAAAIGSTIALGRVSLPGALDRPSIARRRGGNEIFYAEEERWAGPLDDMVRRVLADDLATRVPAGVVLVDSAAKPPPGITVAVELSRFDADETGAVTLASRWETLAPNGRPLGPPRESTLTVPGTGRDAPSVVNAMSRALSDLATQIATGLR